MPTIRMDYIVTIKSTYKGCMKYFSYRLQKCYRWEPLRLPRPLSEKNSGTFVTIWNPTRIIIFYIIVFNIIVIRCSCSCYVAIPRFEHQNLMFIYTTPVRLQNIRSYRDTIYRNTGIHTYSSDDYIDQVHIILTGRMHANAAAENHLEFPH